MHRVDGGNVRQNRTQILRSFPTGFFPRTTFARNIKIFKFNNIICGTWVIVVFAIELTIGLRSGVFTTKTNVLHKIKTVDVDNPQNRLTPNEDVIFAWSVYFVRFEYAIFLSISNLKWQRVCTRQCYVMLTTFEKKSLIKIKQIDNDFDLKIL